MSHVFFTDRDLGKRFPEILAAAGLHVQKHADHFPHDCPDERWLEAVGERGWTAITHDTRIRYKPNERDAVIRNRVALLVVIGGAPFPQLAHNFVATAPKITKFLRNHSPPFIAKVYRPSRSELAKNPAVAGTISLWYPK